MRNVLLHAGNGLLVLALARTSSSFKTSTRAGTAADAFHYLQTLRLRRETNRVRVAELNDIDRRVLKGAFRQATLLQQRLALDFGL